MKRVTFESKQTQSNLERQEYQNTVVWMLHRVGIDLVAFSLSPKCTKAELQQIKVATALIVSACSTAEAAAKFNQELSILTKHSLLLARTFYETCLNAAYALTDAGQIAERAEMYSAYRFFKDQSQVIKTESKTQVLHFEPRVKRNDAFVKRAIEYFENGNGKKRKKCFQDDRSGMIAKIGDVSKSAQILFHGAETAGYQFASEISHGSLYAHQKSNEGHVYGWEPEGISFLTTSLIIHSSEALARVIAEKFPTLENAKHLISTAGLYYQVEAPELSSELSDFYAN
ncbi:DUF5677 domain-containing protein [Ruegeria atlantica]|uniref:DUF5677 domain-containing protein n=1 Tax=Ruegeria atlantica TaxID=81569 RepID=UPI002494B735|nr:DUF5677 domain-containing protein [Ruegeria atlantica]